MKKLTNKQKRKRLNRIRKSQKRPNKINANTTDKKLRPWEPVKMKLFNVPNPIPAEIPKEKRLELVRSIGAQARKDFDEKYPTLEKWFKEYDPLYILSFCSLYFVSHPEGTDPEATGDLEFPHHFLEILQAVSLTMDRTIAVKPLLHEAETFKNEMKEIGELMMLRLLEIPDNFTSDEELHAYGLRTEMMAHTTAIRNWAYAHQMKRVTLDLASLSNAKFKEVYGIGALTLMELLFSLIEERNDLLNDHLDKVRRFIKYRNGSYKKMILAYNDAFPENIPIQGEGIESIWRKAEKNTQNLASMLHCHSDLKLQNIYSFSFDHAKKILGKRGDVIALKAVLDKLSHRFGDLKEHNIDYIILDNPATQRPFIKLDKETYFSAIWGALPHFALDILEDLVWENESLREKYSDTKAKYLEDETEKIFQKYFPNATILRGSVWTDPLSGKVFENDLTVLIDSFAIVVEEKSGVITDSARRGAPDRLFETLKRLIEEPSEQALRFIRLLEGDKKPHTFTTINGTENTIDSSKIKYYIPLGITFSHLGMIGSNLKKLVEAKIVDKPLEELAPSMNFTDLETVLDLLDLESERVHYLARRREIEAHLDYEGDELDLFSFYLDHGFNIGEVEYTKESAFNISLKSKELDPYVIGTSEGLSLTKPALAMTKWWRDLLNTIAERKFPGWMEISFVLLNSTKDDQRKFERAFTNLKRKVRKGLATKPHNWVVFASGPERRRYVIVGYPYTTDDKSLRDNIMSQIFDDEQTKKARGAVVIGVNVNIDDYPYSAFASRLSTDLFDTLTL